MFNNFKKYNDLLGSINYGNIDYRIPYISAENLYYTSGVAKAIVDKPIYDAIRNGITADKKLIDYIEKSCFNPLFNGLKLMRIYGESLIINKNNEFIVVKDFNILRNKFNTISYEAEGGIFSIKNAIHLVNEINYMNADNNLSGNEYNEDLNKTFLGVFARDSIRNSIVQYEEFNKTLHYLLQTDGLNVIGIENLNDKSDQNKLNIILNRIKDLSLNRLRSKTVITDTEDNYSILNLKLDYLDSMRETLMIKIAADAEIPMRIIFGLQPKGFNDGESSTLDYIQRLEIFQKMYIKPILDWMIYLYNNINKKNYTYNLNSPEIRSFDTTSKNARSLISLLGQLAKYDTIGKANSSTKEIQNYVFNYIKNYLNYNK